MEIIVKPGYAIVNTKGLHSAVIQVGFLAGSRFDEKGKGSLSHLTEHLFVISLENASLLPDPAFKVLSEIDGQTNRELLYSYIKTTPSHMSQSIDRMMCSIYRNPLGTSSFESEKETILGAALQNEHNQDPYDLVFAKTFDLIFSSHPIGHSEVGTSEAAQTITVEDCVQHFQARYREGKKYLVIACDFDQVHLDSILRSWGTMLSNTGSVHSVSTSPPFPTPKSQTLSLNKEVGTVEMTFSVPIPKTKNVPFWLMNFVNYVLGKPPNSLLFKLIREKYALAYDTRSLCFHYTDGSFFVIYAGVTNPKNQTQATERIEELLTHFSAYLTEEQLALYKQAYVEQYWMNSDHLVNFSRSLIATALIQAPMHPDDLLSHIQSITLHDIENFVSTYLNPSHFARVVVK
jgi:predicted Zn-dependent peptidase